MPFFTIYPLLSSGLLVSLSFWYTFPGPRYYLHVRSYPKLKPIPNWAKIRNQLAIRFEGRYPL